MRIASYVFGSARRGVAIVASAVLMAALVARGDTTPFAKIADSSTPAPGSAGNFVGFQEPNGGGGLFVPAIDGSYIAFGGEGSPGDYGLYLWHNGTISPVVDFKTPIPSGTGHFTGLSPFPHLSGTTVVFRGAGATNYGLYASIGGNLQRIADTTTIPPGQAGALSGFGYPVISGNNIFFNGTTRTPAESGIYRYSGGMLGIVADQHTPVPSGTLHFTALNTNLAAGGGGVAFTWFGIAPGGMGQGGVYAYQANSLMRLVGTFAPAPDPPNTFGGFDNIVIGYDGTTAVVKAYDGGRRGLFAVSDGTARSIIFDGEPSPGGGTFDASSVWGASISGSHVAFQDDATIYSDLGGSLQRVVGPGDELFGKTVSGAVMYDQGLSGTELVFTAAFTDGSSGVYLIPEPPTPALLVLPAAIMLWRARRRT